MRAVNPMKKVLWLVVACAMVALPATVSAQGFEVQRFHPAGSLRTGYLTVFQGSTDLPKRWETSLYLQYGHDPLRMEVNGIDSEFITGQFVAHSLTSVAIQHWLRLSLELPVVLLQSAEWGHRLGLNNDSLEKAGLGDIRVIPAFSFYDGRRGEEPWETYTGVAVGLVIPVSLPTGDPDRFQGESVRAEPRLAFDFATVSGWGVGLNLGVMLREETDFRNLRLAHMFTFGAAARAPVVPDLFSLVLDVSGQMTPGSDQLTSQETPVEALLAAVFEINDFIVSAGGGFGISDGYGTPSGRALLSFGYSPVVPEPEPEPDTDGDGYVDSLDGCPYEPEDFDGFEDHDGCPDLDHDGDGILSPWDKCPDEPEDFDLWFDTDGCPETDNDEDGILDPDDSCPNEPETFNEYQDEDGCPDVVPIVVTTTHIEIGDKIFFDFDSEKIQPRSDLLLDAIAETITAHPELTAIQIEGHTDTQGPESYNLRLSERRARAVLEALVERGVDVQRLRSVGYGESRLVMEGETDEAHEANRRVEFLILERAE